MNENNYGFLFNEFSIDNNILTKKPKNDYGVKVIKNEINFYRFIINNKINFPIPAIYSLENNSIRMEYLKNYVPLHTVFYTYSNSIQTELYKMIVNKISILHDYNKITINTADYNNRLYHEVVNKIKQRINTIQDVLDDFKHIKSVNSINISHNIHNLCIIIYHYLIDHPIDLCPIHGDIHLGNILFNSVSCDIKFIDPRGHFANHEIYGIPTYDFAKLLFGLSGYSVFDGMDINELNITGDNIDIDFIKKYEKNILINDDKCTLFLTLSIWLGNCSMFKNKNKILTSYFTALYLCAKYL